MQNPRNPSLRIKRFLGVKLYSPRGHQIAYAQSPLYRGDFVIILIMTDARIIRRQLTKKEAEEFSREMMLTPNITGYRHEELTNLKGMLVVEVAGNAVGILAYAETSQFIDLKILL